MATPSEKEAHIESLLDHALGVDRRECIINDECVGCGCTAQIFRTDLAHREFEISGLCQSCQDFVFMEPDEDEEYLND